MKPRIAFEAGVHTVSVISGSLKRLFYKNWSFIRRRPGRAQDAGAQARSAHER